MDNLMYCITSFGIPVNSMKYRNFWKVLSRIAILSLDVSVFAVLFMNNNSPLVKAYEKASSDALIFVLLKYLGYAVLSIDAIIFSCFVNKSKNIKHIVYIE